MSKLILLLIISAYSIYFFVTPPLTTNDEEAHVKIISGVAQGEYPYTIKNKKVADTKELGVNRRLGNALNDGNHAYQIPTFTTVSKLKENNKDYNMQDIYSHEAYSPPFYYFIGAIFYYIAKTTSYLLWQFYILRLTSTLFYFGTVYMAWKNLLLFFKNKNIASSILLIFAINPLVLKMGIGINPDIGVTFFSLLFLYLLLKLTTKELMTKNVLLLSLISALTAMTKISGIFTNAVFVIYMVFRYRFRKSFFLRTLLFEIIFILLTLPWFLFAYNRYGTFFPVPFTINCLKLGHYSLFTNIFNAFTTFRFTIMEYAGFMGEGWPYPFKWFFVSYVLIFVIFLLLGVWFVLKQKKVIYKILIIYVVPLFLFLLAQSILYKILGVDCPIQGRYLLPVFLILNIFVFWGILKITKNEEQAALIVRSFAIFQYLFILFTVLLLRYYV